MKQSVKLVAITKPIIEGVNSADELIAYCARVSNPSNQLNTETAPRLLAYLIKNKHWSPFEMVSMTVEINTTRDIARQILRHRSFSFQEFSQRYSDPVKELDFTTRECRLQDPKNRQNSISNVNDYDLQLEWEDTQEYIIEEASRLYTKMIKQGIAKEQARAILPEGLVMSRLYMSGTLRSFIHYIQVRESNGTQKEHSEIALMIKNIINEQFPSLQNLI